MEIGKRNYLNSDTIVWNKVNNELISTIGSKFLSSFRVDSLSNIDNLNRIDTISRMRPNIFFKLWK